MGLSYATPVDMWACGCIFAELFTRDPLFDGKYEMDQLAKIFAIQGTPAEWPENAAVLPSNFADMPKRALSQIIPELEPNAEDLLEVCNFRAERSTGNSSKTKRSEFLSNLKSNNICLNFQKSIWPYLPRN